MRNILVYVALLTSLWGWAWTPDSACLERARLLHRTILTLDSHTDAPLEWDEKGYTLGGDHPNCVTLDKMEQGALDAQYMAAYVASDYKSKGRKGVYTLNERTFAHRRREALKLLDLTLQQIDANAGRCALATTARDVRDLKQQGRRAMLLGVENGLCIGHDLDFIDTLKAMGVTYITLTHVYDNQICGSSSKSVRHHGLTPFGRLVIGRMNSLGMIIDLSHASQQTFDEVMALSTRPVVCSHSGVMACHRNDRNLTDNQLRALRDNGGVVQIVAYAPFLGKNRRRVSVEHLCNHIDHAVKVAGIDHVGIGTDFDGGGGIEGLGDDSQFVNITAELLRRGYTEPDIAKIMGLNYLRVLEANTL